jgi:hypothetical protein
VWRFNLVVLVLGAGAAFAYPWVAGRTVSFDRAVSKVVVSKDERSIEVHARMPMDFACSIVAEEAPGQVTVVARCHPRLRLDDTAGIPGTMKVSKTVALKAPLGGRSIRTKDGAAVKVERLGASGGS